jgi:DNA invertase Pin-like site-specific DNA recombinase
MRGSHRTPSSAVCGAPHTAEFERTLIISRTNDGRVAAKARGVAFGRPKKMRPDQQQLARELVRDGKSISAVARTFNVHTATIYRVIEG